MIFQGRFCDLLPATSGVEADQIIRRLHQVVKESPDLANAARVYKAILPLLRGIDFPVPPVSLTPEQARALMGKGVPLLRDVPLEIDIDAASKLMLRMARAVESAGEDPDHRQYTSEAAGRICRAIEKNMLKLDTLLSHIASGDRSAAASAALDLELDPVLLRDLAENALKPSLRAWCRQLTPLVQGISWNKGTCFVCGAVATIGELQGNYLAKHLRCGQCGADWQFRRLQCMYCGNEDHRTLGYLYPENENGTPRLEVCHTCRGYLKVITAFTPTPAEMLPVEDLATLHLDYIAQERGYVRGNVL